MARVRAFGAEFSAKPIRKLPNGDWIMEAREHSARTSIGTQFRVTEREIVLMDDRPQDIPVADRSMAELIAGLEDERKTLPSIQEVLAKFHADNKKEKSDGQAQA